MPLSAEASAAMMAVLAAPVGALIGVIVAPGEKWAPVSAGPVRLGAGREACPSSGLFVALRF